MLLPCKTMRSRVSARVGESVEPGRVIRPALDQFGQCAHPGERPVGRPVRQGQSVSVRHQPGPRLTTVGTCHRQYHARRGISATTLNVAMTDSAGVP